MTRKRLDEGAVEKVKRTLQERFGDPIVFINGNQTDGTNRPPCCNQCSGMMDLEESLCTQCGMMSEDGGSSMHEDMLGQGCRECRKGTYDQPRVDDGSGKVVCSWCGATTDHFRYIEPDNG